MSAATDAAPYGFTVAELIEELREFPPAAIVYVGKGMGPATTLELLATPQADFVKVTP